MSISDELDHLGLYIEKNMYSLDVAKLENCHVFYGGYREDLDKYFSPIHLGKSIEKPQQFISEEIRKILNACTEKSGKDIVRFTNFLLDMSDEAREIFSDSIRSLSNRELELGRMIPATFLVILIMCCL